MSFLLDFLFPKREMMRLHRQFVSEHPDAIPFFEQKLRETEYGVVTIDDLTPHHRYELWSFIKSIAPTEKP